ncbi:MAG TPA: NPCBM/NEW2 domain-containing protein [Vicinamibacterales bacterium]|nr:NPCBM/NEW2 domain-containing protein [Vicinamibacterales bacterium]
MTKPRLRFATAAALTLAVSLPLAGARQDAAALQGADPPANGIWVDSLDLSKTPIRRPRGQRGQTTPPPPLTFRLGGATYAHALPLQSDGDLTIDLGGTATKFVAMIGVDDGGTPAPNAPPAPSGSVVFGAWVDGKKVFESDVMKRGDTPKPVSIDLAGAQKLVLAVMDANDGTAGDNADWGGAAIIAAAGKQASIRVAPPVPEATPSIAASRTSAPTINYPRITGATPGRPFLFRIPASGDAPLTFTARNLPAGLKLDPAAGIITGSLQKEGRTDVAVSVKAKDGKMSNAVITIVGGKDALALTPPLGWNSWNVWAAQVDDAKVRAAADAMDKSGLAAQGYTYINIDDAWEGARTATGEITSNEKFPDMKALTDYIHAKGLKAGIYSSPGPRTCQRVFAGSYQHEEQDARTWAKWGFDYIKYDWCSYTDVEPLAARAPLDALQKPYKLMRTILDTLDRDLVFSLCQYGWGNVWEWGANVGGDLWRVTGDITDTWVSMSSIGFQQTGHEKFAGPGHWNDTDMLVVGHVGWGRAEKPRPTNLTPNEQLTHISLWALQAAPLLIGADLSQIDEWTVNLLGNREVLAINQDPLGKAAGRVWADNWTQVWARQLSDGTVAVGLFNRAPQPMPVTVKFADVGLPDNAPIRFPWTHDVLGGIAGSGKGYTATVPRHGVVLIKVGRPASKS